MSFDIDEVADLAYRMKLVIRLYLHGHPQATPQELERVAVTVAGVDHDEETVIASHVVALVQLRMEEIGLQIPARDPLLTEAILDNALIDLQNPHPDIHKLARKSYLLYVEYASREKKSAVSKARPVE